MRLVLVLLTLAFGCGDPPIVSHSFELAITGFSHEAYAGDEGRRGLNLDERDSDDADALGCHHEDIVDPVDGETGVDNAYGQPSPTGDPLTPFAEPPLVDLRIEARADLSKAERLAITFDSIALPEAEVFDGRFRALGSREAAWTLELPFDDETVFTVVVRGPAIEGRINEVGELVELVVGGRFDIEEVIAAALAVAPDIDPMLIRTTLQGIADLDPDEDGDCQSVSLAFLAEVTE